MGDGELHWTIRDVAVVSGCGTGYSGFATVFVSLRVCEFGGWYVGVGVVDVCENVRSARRELCLVIFPYCWMGEYEVLNPSC
jgi:hypothetical protein